MVIGILVSGLIIIGCFICVIILILTEKMNRAIVAITGGLISYFTLTFIEGKDFSTIVALLFGSQADNYVNLHSLVLIIGIMFIVHISDEIGTFQFLAVIMIKMSRGKPIPLMIILCTVSVIFSSLLNNILTVMILIPLTITASRVLNVSPTPYILTQAIMVNIGGTFFSISSIPNILIFNPSTGVSFIDYFFEIGLFSVIVFIFSLGLFTFLYKNELSIPKDKAIKILLDDFDVWNVVQSPRLLYASLGGLISLMISFIIFPAELLPPDVIALSIAMLLTIISRLDAKEIIDKFDFELIFYLLGIFVIAGGLEEVGVVDLLSNVLQSIGGGNEFVQLILIMWIAAFSSSFVDNVPVTKVFIPIVQGIASNSYSSTNRYFYGLSIGANWGDNLTPLGDNILVLNIAKENNRPISIKTFWKLGFISTLYQLFLATLFFTFLYNFTIGIIISGFVGLCLGILAILLRFGPFKIHSVIDMFIFRFKKLVIT
ncbi:MAG: SLC13 family permease [Candidatus Hodarchaeales archaeon]|jgi:Na+/H+ antiporter NhaD/arsenite permease-like protein